MSFRFMADPTDVSNRNLSEILQTAPGLNEDGTEGPDMF